jgi:hypothetical protein
MRERPADEETPRASPNRDCEVEVTRLISPDRSDWWTLGFEAHGALEAVEATLTDTVAVLASHLPLPVPQGRPDNYPSWLASQTW